MIGELLERCTTGGPAHAADGVTAPGDDNKELVAEHKDLVRVLPHDVLGEIFRRLAPRWIAACRCVCRDWCAGIDGRRLLRADLLPLSSYAIFVHFYYHNFPELFARRFSTGVSAITGRLDFLPNPNVDDTSIEATEPGSTDYFQEYLSYSVQDSSMDYDIEDHCNGLLLLDKYVVNPATRRWDPLPACPPSNDHPTIVIMNTDDDYLQTTFKNYLAFDPTVSPHYEVFTVPDTCDNFHGDTIDPMVEESRLLSSSSTCALHVFSSRYGNWEWRSFVREGSAAEVVGKCKSFDFDGSMRQSAVYWRGALYVQRNANFVVRISPSNNTYRVISPPVGVKAKHSKHPTRYLGRSEKGVYFAALDNYRLQVWILSDSSCQTEWILKLDKDIAPVLLAQYCDRQVHKSSILEDVNYNKAKIEGFNSGDNEKAIVKGKLQSRSHPPVTILGFHPYKEIIFLNEAVERIRRLRGSVGTGLAYHLSTSKVEDLGNICPTNYLDFKYYPKQGIIYSFIYTPCWLEEFPRNS